MRFSFILSLALLWVGVSIGQSLPQKGSLGIFPTAYQGSDPALQGKPTISKITAKSAAEKAGWQVGDVILSAEGISFNSVSELLAYLKDKKAGDQLEFVLSRAGQTSEKTVVLEAYHPPIPDGTSYEKLAFRFGGGLQRAVIQKPKGKGPFPVVFFIQGFTCQSVDNMSPYNAYQRISNTLVSEGFAIYRIEKLGVGESAGPQGSCEQCGFDKEFELFEAGFEFLLDKEDPSLMLDEVFLWGHSMGGTQAPLLLQNPKFAKRTKKVVISGSSFRPWFDYMDRLFRDQSQILGMDSATANAQADMLQPLSRAYLLEKKSPLELVKLNPEYEASLKGAYSWDGGEQIILRHYSFWQELSDVDLKKAWTKIDIPLLAVYGEADLEAVDATGAKALVDFVQKQGKEAEFYLAKNTDHAFTKVPGKLEAWQMKRAGTYAKHSSENFSEQAVLDIINWMKSNS